MSMTPHRPNGRPPFAPRDVPRLFVAIPIPSDITARISTLVDDVKEALGPDGSKVRWVQMEGLHVTLRFLGPTPKGQIDAVAAAVDRLTGVVAAPFVLRVGGAGAFPEPTRPRALWLGIRSGAEELGELSSALTGQLVEAGWAIEDRPFRPHLTIARTDGVHAGAAAGNLLVANCAELDLGFTVDEIVLFRSHLGHGAARYERLHSVPLA